MKYKKEIKTTHFIELDDKQFNALKNIVLSWDTLTFHGQRTNEEYQILGLFGEKDYSE